MRTNNQLLKLNSKLMDFYYLNENNLKICNQNQFLFIIHSNAKNFQNRNFIRNNYFKTKKYQVNFYF